MSPRARPNGNGPPSRNFRAVCRPIGLLLGGLGVAMLACAPVGFLTDSPEGASHMGTSAMCTACIAALFLLVGRKAQPGEIGRREALLVVVASWILASVIGGIPFLLGADFTLVAAIFESTSGFTTTGATILPEITDRLNPPLHLWRVLSHWLGGMGIVVLFVAVFPALGVGGRHLFHTEAPGPRSKGISPRIRERSAMLWRVYVVLTLVEVALLVAVGIGPFSALVHSLSTMGTGGFSSLNGSVREMHSGAAEWIILGFMLVAGMNFSVIQQAIRQGPKALLQHTESKAYGLIFLAAALAVACTTWQSALGLETVARNAAFQAASILTTTGFGTTDFEVWPTFAKLILLVLYFVGGSSGSTAGGLKVIRVLILFRAAAAEISRMFRPHVVRTVRVGQQVVSDETLREVIAFVAMFAMTVLVGAALVALLDPVDGTTALMASLACTANVGPGLGLVGPTDHFGFFSPAAKMVLSTCMLLGRLEVLTALSLLLPSFWRR